MHKLTVSIVLYQTDFDEVQNVLNILGLSSLKPKIYLVDNSPNDELRSKVAATDAQYIYTGKNVGFGAGHNLAINIAKDISEYHLVLNADVDFDSSILEKIYSYMNENQEVGLVAPKIYNPDGSIQYSAKLLPTPANLIVRRFIPIRWLQKRLDNRYEFRFSNFNRIINVPYVMGCFMFINCEVFEKVSGFDERFFMYPEDIDLTRRIHKHARTIYYPKVSIVHSHGKGSYKDRKLLYYHVTSMIKYFNKWGWIFDKERKNVNKAILAQFKQPE
ncbi:glycosyltransferase [Maribacter sp. R77961]|uniref:glycosyltransferase n=1 Tax=Maribacter sp. R77961 TaxID=3093871 RepID=UPI0037CC8D31